MRTHKVWCPKNFGAATQKLRLRLRLTFSKTKNLSLKSESSGFGTKSVYFPAYFRATSATCLFDFLVSVEQKKKHHYKGCDFTWRAAIQTRLVQRARIFTLWCCWSPIVLLSLHHCSPPHLSWRCLHIDSILAILHPQLHVSPFSILKFPCIHQTSFSCKRFQFSNPSQFTADACQVVRPRGLRRNLPRDP